MMLPNDAQARRLREQSFLFSDFLWQHRRHLTLLQQRRPALLHLHCHQKTVLNPDAERALLRSLQLDFREPEDGCCGMAGSFGFEDGKYEVSLRCAELELLPAVRASAADTLLIASGYSCREQLVQATGREVLHVAEVMRKALPPAA